MDINLYALEHQVKSRLGEARAAGARNALLASLRPRRPDAVATLGLVLIRLGRRLNRGRGARRRATGSPLPSLP